MLDILMSGYGVSGMGLIALIVFMLYMKLMKWVFKIAILGIALIGAYWYFHSSAGV
jgi:hypothetical protein